MDVIPVGAAVSLWDQLFQRWFCVVVLASVGAVHITAPRLVCECHCL